VNFHTYLFDFAASIPVRIGTGDIFMAPDTHTIDFNETFLTLDLAEASALENSSGHSDYADAATLSAATKRTDLDEEDDDDEEEEDEEDDDEYEDDEEEDDEEEEDDDEFEDDEEEDDDEEADEDDVLDDDEDEDLDDDDEDEDGGPKLIRRR
jgi:hypothetical protein